MCIARRPSGTCTTPTSDPRAASRPERRRGELRCGRDRGDDDDPARVTRVPVPGVPEHRSALGAPRGLHAPTGRPPCHPAIGNLTLAERGGRPRHVSRVHRSEGRRGRCHCVVRIRAGGLCKGPGMTRRAGREYADSRPALALSGQRVAPVPAYEAGSAVGPVAFAAGLSAFGERSTVTVANFSDAPMLSATMSRVSRVCPVSLSV